MLKHRFGKLLALSDEAKLSDLQIHSHFTQEGGTICPQKDMKENAHSSIIHIVKIGINSTYP